MGKHLFIGGSKDGQWMETSDSDYMRVAINTPVETLVLDPPATQTIKEQLYKRHLLKSNSFTDRYVYVYGEIDIIKALVNGYKSNSFTDNYVYVYGEIDIIKALVNGYKSNG